MVRQGLGAPAETGARYDYARFVSVRRAYGPSVSPDGRRVAFVADLTGVPQVFAVGPEGGWPERLTFTQERVGAVHCAHGDDRMIVASDVGGDEQIQLYLLSRHGETMTPLTAHAEASHLFGGWSPDDRSIAYAANRRDPSRFDVYVQDVATGDARIVFEASGLCQVAAWSPDGACLLVHTLESSADGDLVEVRLADGQVRTLTPHHGTARFECPVYEPGGEAIVLATNQDSDLMSIVRLERRTLARAPMVMAGGEVEDLALSRDGERLAYSVNVDGYCELHVLEPRTGKTWPIEVPPGVVGRDFVGNWNDRLTWTPDGRRLLFSLTTARATQDVWVADVESRRARRLTEASQAGIPVDALADAQLIRYPTFDGREIPAFLYVPRDAQADGARAAVVLIHGGPESQSRPGFNATIQYFVHRGYVVIDPNVRGSSGYGKTYMSLDDVERRMDAVADANAAAAWLVTSRWAAPGRIAAMGQSYGGFMVLACLATAPETWAAGVDIYGIANFVSFLETTHPMRRRHREAEYGSLAAHRDLLERISPLSQVERIRTPLFAVHGERDIRVPIGETVQIVEALKARGVPVEFIRLPDEGHGLVRLANLLRVYPAIAEFLDRHLGG